MRKGPPVIRMAMLFLALLGSLTLVVWRQSRALEELRRLETVRAERVVEEARRATLVRRVEEMESRARVSHAARERLGMRLPTGEEIVILPLTSPVVVRGPAAEALASAAVGRGGG